MYELHLIKIIINQLSGKIYNVLEKYFSIVELNFTQKTKQKHINIFDILIAFYYLLFFYFIGAFLSQNILLVLLSSHVYKLYLIKIIIKGKLVFQ